MGSVIEYRKATADDIHELLKVRMDFLINAGNIKGGDENDELIEANRDYILKSLDNGSFVQWLAVVDGNIIATGSVTIYLLPPNSKRLNGRVSYIGNMFTYPEYRNKGIARHILSLCVDSARELGCCEVLLNATEMGRPLYENYGFLKSDDSMYLFIK